MAYLHERGVKGFVATNVLIFDEELPAVEALVRHIATCGVDAVIVQVKEILFGCSGYEPGCDMKGPGGHVQHSRAISALAAGERSDVSSRVHAVWCFREARP